MDKITKHRKRKSGAQIRAQKQFYDINFKKSKSKQKKTISHQRIGSKDFKLLRPPQYDEMEKRVVIATWLNKPAEEDRILHRLPRQNDLSELGEMKVVSYMPCNEGRYLKLDVTAYAWKWLKANNRKVFFGLARLTFRLLKGSVEDHIKKD